jgi:hypothetical protein
VIEGSKIKNYITSTTSGSVVNLAAADLQNTSVDYYWVNGGEDLRASYQVDIGSITFGGDGYFDVKKPTAQTVVGRGPINVLNQKFSNGAPGQSGIGIIVNSLNNYGFPGSLSWIQLLDSSLRRVNDTVGLNPGWFRLEYTSSNNIRMLDRIMSVNPFVDSPNQITHADFETIEMEEHFYTWLMFKPSSANSIAVPLMKVYWYWEGIANNNNPPGQNDDDEWNVTNTDKNDNIQMEVTTDFPRWNSNVSSLELIHE